MAAAILNVVSACAAFLAGMMFLRFWRESRDSVFLWFSLAFWLLMVNWTVVATVQPPDEGQQWIYCIRLVAFLMILIAVLDKNRLRRS